MAARRTLAIVAALAVVAALGGVGGYVAWKGAETARLQRTLAEKIAASISAEALDQNDFHATPGALPVAEFATIVKGMGTLKPAVTVASVTPRQGNDTYADAVLRYSWPVPKQQPWTYDVTVPLQLTADGWRAGWTASIVAPGLKDNERLLFNRLSPTRGSIVGAGGTPLAFVQPALRIGIDKTRVDAAVVDAAARELARQLTAAGLPTDANTFAAKVAAAGPKAFVEAALLRIKDPKQAALAQRLQGLPGVNGLQVNAALGISATFLRPVLGQVGDATAEIVAASGGAIVAGDQVGTGGLQKAQDAVLRGTGGYVVQAVLRDGAQARDLVRVSATDGRDVHTTIDARLQAAAETILAGVGPASAIVAIRPSDGALLTIASGPGSAGVVSTATQGLYEPGSTFKTVSGLAMLRHGLTTASTLPCTPSIVVDGYTFNNDQGYPASALGTIPWTTAFAHSCNTAVISQASAVSQGDLASAAGALGLVGGPSIGTPVTASRVPETASGATEHAASMIGQGKVLTTPYGMATVVASIAKGGLVRPVLLLDAPSVSPSADPGTPSAGSPSAGTGTPSAPASTASVANPITADEASALRTLMRGVVTQGTAQSALAGTPGPEIMAKTGTATYVKDGQQRYHTWLVAIQGDLAVAVMVADGDYGASTCGPLLKAYLTAANGR